MQKTILITGASTGIGVYVAHELKKRGYRAIASCRSMEDVARLQQEGLECVQLELANSESIRRGFEEVMMLTGKPQARYYVAFPTYLVGFMKRILPVALLDKLLRKLGS